MQGEKPERPEPRWWAQSITLQEFETFTPEKFELVSGYLFDGPDDHQRRLDLLALLLKNCGLEAAAFLSSRDDWREATEHAFGATFE